MSSCCTFCVRPTSMVRCLVRASSACTPAAHRPRATRSTPAKGPPSAACVPPRLARRVPRADRGDDDHRVVVDPLPGQVEQRYDTSEAERLVSGICLAVGIIWEPAAAPGGATQLAEALARMEERRQG